MKRWLPALLLGGALLSSCGSGGNGLGMLGNRVAIDPQASDGNSQITVTRTIKAAVPGTGDNPGTPASDKVAIGESGSAEITFISRPTSDAVYLTSYRVTRNILYTAEGTRDLTDPAAPAESVRIYVPSGWSCPETQAGGNAQSCTFYTGTGELRTDVVPANGAPSAPYLLDISSGLANTAIATESSVSRVMDLEFTGQSASGQPVKVKVTGVSGRANYIVQFE